MSEDVETTKVHFAMTDRELLGVIRERLLMQDGPSRERKNSEGFGFCRYRSADGRRCAAGVLIAEEHYDPRLELNTVIHDVVWQALVRSGVPDKNSTKVMVREAQARHDAHPSDLMPEQWRSNIATSLSELMFAPDGSYTGLR